MKLMDPEEEWYWLRKIYFLMAESNVLLDWVVPVATTLLAVAAIYLAYRSFRAAKDSNDQTAQFRKEDRDERDLRWRRTFAVDIRDWSRREYINALYNSPPSQDEARVFRKLMRKADIAGQDSAKRLARWLSWQAATKRGENQSLTPRELALRRHPSRMIIPSTHDELIDSWVRDPASATPKFDALDAEREAEQVAMLERIDAARAARSETPDPPVS